MAIQLVRKQRMDREAMITRAMNTDSGQTIRSRMFKWGAIIFAVFCVLLADPAASDLSPDPAALEQRSCLEIEVFSRKGCPHCADAYEFLEQLHQEFPSLRVHRREVVGNAENLQRFRVLNELYGVQNPGVPSFLAFGQFAVGLPRADRRANC